MADKVLVAYGTRYGATAEIAEKIGETLRAEGLQADVLPAGRTGDPNQYQAFVIGSSIYAGFWRKDVVNFIKKNTDLLAGHPTWIFSSGPTGDEDIAKSLAEWPYPPKLKPSIETIKPKDVTMFHGAAFAEKLNLLHKFMLKMVKAPVGDFRKWDVIEGWSKSVAAELKK